MKVSIAGSLRDREVACSTSDRQGSNFESCVWRTVSSQSSHQPKEALLAQFSLYVHKGGLKIDSFHFYYIEKARDKRLAEIFSTQAYIYIVKNVNDNVVLLTCLQKNHCYYVVVNMLIHYHMKIISCIILYCVTFF